MKIFHQIKKLGHLIQLRDKIHLNPAWQRGSVWSTSKQALLVDSILRGYDIPMIYLRECVPAIPYQYEVVDGQQRLRSLWNFIDEEYALPKDLDNIEKVAIAGKTYYNLPKTLRDRISDFVVVVAFVKNAREPEISRLFSRMQMGVRLNPPELRNAVQTGLRHAIDGVARLHPFFQNSRIPSARFKHQDYLAHAISICIHRARRDLKAQQLMDDYNSMDSRTYTPLMADTEEILTFLAKVNERTSKRIKQKWIFVDLFYILYQNKTKLSRIRPKDFAETYVEFDQRRLEHTAEPEELLIGKPTDEQEDLYYYILAFKISGGERKNLEQRNEILKRYFKPVLEANNGT